MSIKSIEDRLKSAKERKLECQRERRSAQQRENQADSQIKKLEIQLRNAYASGAKNTEQKEYDF